MSKLEILQIEKITLENKTDEDYELENYAQYIYDTYSFVPTLLTLYGYSVSNLSRALAIGFMTQAIIIYSIAIF